MPEVLKYPLHVKHMLPGGGVNWYSGPRVQLVPVENGPAYVAVHASAEEVHECHGGTVHIQNADNVTIETIAL